MRVLHLVTATHQRGAETVARNLADEMTLRATAGRLVALVPGNQESGAIKVDGVLASDPSDHLRWFPAAVAGLQRELRDHPADVILAHGAHAAFVSAALPTSPPIVWHRILESPKRRQHHPFRIALRALVKRISGAIAITPGIGHEMRDLGFRGPVWLVPNHRPAPKVVGAEAEEVARLEIRRQVGFEADARIVSLIGHLVPQKDPFEAIEVFERIGASDSTVRFVVAGDGPLRAEVEARAIERLGHGRVAFLGHRPDVDAVFAATDVVLLTSRSDSMPGIAIEAQLAGRPVVSYPVDGIDEILVDGVTGFVTATRSPSDAAIACLQLLSNPPRRAAMGAAARLHAQPLTTEHVTGRYEAILDMVASTPSDERIRVMHVLPDLGVGGAEQALQVLATTIPDHDVAQVVTAIGGTRRPIEETVHSSLQRAGVGYCDLGVQSSATRSPRALMQSTLRLRRLVRRTNIDVVDSALLDASLPSRLGPTGVVRFTHLVNTTYESVVGSATGARRWRRAVLRWVDALTSRRDTRLIALTDAVADSNARALGLSAVRAPVVIARGVDLERFCPPIGPRDPHLVVSVGRLVPQKGHETLIEAVGLANAAGGRFKLNIVGEGPLGNDLLALIRELDLTSVVRLVGPQADVRPQLASASIFALASRWEGQSNAVLEAMAMGLPVILSDIPAFREVVGEAGCLSPVDEPSSWARALTNLAENAILRSDLGNAARRRATDHFDAAERSWDLVQEYRQALSAARVQP